MDDNHCYFSFDRLPSISKTLPMYCQTYVNILMFEIMDKACMTFDETIRTVFAVALYLRDCKW